MKKHTIHVTLLLSALLLAGFIGALSANSTSAQAQRAPPQIYVSPSGSDSTGSGSLASPYATISHAVSVAPTGAVINIEPGTYNEMVNITHSVTLESTSGQPSNTVVNAAGKNFGIWIRGSAAARTTVDGLTIENANSHGIYVEDTSYILLENNQVLHNVLSPFPACPTGRPPTGPCVETQTAIELDGVSYSTVAYNTISESVGDGGIAVHSDSSKLNPGALTPGENESATGNIILGNIVIANHGGCGIVISSFDAGFPVSDTLVTGNTVIDQPAGVIVATNGPFETVTNTTVTDNQLLNNFAGPGVDIVNVAGMISGTVVSGNNIAGNGVPSLPATGQPTGIAMASIALPHLPPPLTNGTVVSGNNIYDEHFGVYFNNATVGTVVTDNSVDPSVNVPFTGVTASESSLNTISSEVSSLQSSLNSENAQVSTLSAVSYAALGVAVVLGLAAIILSVRKRG